ncbi:ferric reductase [Paramyrothecium foliicola]|nr:ferric reductase [Paramyrothecium foliicola]
MLLLKVAALVFTLAISAAISIALINFSCYATFCSEDYFTFETRLHLIVFYGFLATVLCFLLGRACSPTVRYITNLHLSHALPLVGKRITLGGLGASIALLAITGGPTIFWLPAQRDFWGLRADPLNWASAKFQLTVTGVAGHYADILLGLLLIPVSRNSLIAQAFSVHQSTLLYAHKIISYLFSTSVIVHGVAYILYDTDTSSDGDKARDEAFATGNPAMTLAESKQRSSWFTQTTYVGIAAVLPVFVILITSIPWIRRRHYNLFYFSHVILGILILVGSCIHASTNFYLLLPGLLLWIADWIRRLFFGEANGLVRKTPAVLENADNGWLKISLLPTKVITCQPLLYYYLNFPSISKFQNHAFTAAVHHSANGGPVFLVRPTGGKAQEELKKEWTWRLWALVPEPMASLRLDVRVEGPYPVSDTSFKTASQIVCIVGGTGLTGALSLAHWWLRTRPANSRLDLLWTVRRRESTKVEEWVQLDKIAKTFSNLTVTTHISSESGRLDPKLALRNALSLGQSVNIAPQSRGWVYSSGPATLLSATECACVQMQKEIRSGTQESAEKCYRIQDLSWYMARWEIRKVTSALISPSRNSNGTEVHLAAELHNPSKTLNSNAGTGGRFTGFRALG